ncbi:hypothetical protein [Listeria monocytogenes]|uniref:hypothetical protein n=1 Tax=Listeria monocytogenes TaxID=1639 RepID=UPI0015C7DB9E|nr:hypothetical protein [Listeria monocytogenes]
MKKHTKIQLNTTGSTVVNSIEKIVELKSTSNQTIKTKLVILALSAHLNTPMITSTAIKPDTYGAIKVRKNANHRSTYLCGKRLSIKIFPNPFIRRLSPQQIKWREFVNDVLTNGTLGHHGILLTKLV